MFFEYETDKEMVAKVMDFLQIPYEKHKYFNDGAVSRVILLNDKYLIKQNNNIDAELEFFKYNDIDMFQKIIYVDPDHRYVAYEFLEGKPMMDVTDPKDVINKVLEITSLYNTYDKEGYGYYLERVSTWEEFLKSETEHSSRNTKEYIKDLTFIYECIEKLCKYPFVKKVIHGDLGTHNFIEKDGKFVGVIDPDTIIGDSLYDILFAIVSNVDILNTVTLDDLYALIKEEKEKIYCMLVVVLFSRISRCLKYHKEDIDIYMNFYNYLLENKII